MERGRAGECQPSPPSEPQKGTKVWASLQELPRLLASSGGGFGGNLTGNTTPPKMPALNDGSLRFFSPLVFFWGMQNIGFSRKCPDVFVFFGSTCQKFWKQKAAENSEKLWETKNAEGFPFRCFFRNNRGDCDTSIGFFRWFPSCLLSDVGPNRRNSKWPQNLFPNSDSPENSQMSPWNSWKVTKHSFQTSRLFRGNICKFLGGDTPNLPWIFIALPSKTTIATLATVVGPWWDVPARWGSRGGVGGGMEGLEGLKICQKGWGYQTDGVKDFNLSSVMSMGTYYKLAQKKFSGWLTQWFFSILVWCHEVEQEMEESGFFSFPEKELRDSVKSIFETPRCDFCMVEITSKEKIESVEFCLFSISKVVPKHLWNNTMNLYPTEQATNSFQKWLPSMRLGGSISSGGIWF